MQVPEDLRLEAEVWEDKEDHSKGTLTHPIRFLRINEAGVIEPVDFQADDEGVRMRPWRSYNNFARFEG